MIAPGLIGYAYTCLDLIGGGEYLSYMNLAKRSSQTGEPIVKPMCWFWPESGYEQIHDQFILGDDLLVAPVVQKSSPQSRGRPHHRHLAGRRRFNRSGANDNFN
jgi:hypothetical protein